MISRLRLRLPLLLVVLGAACGPSPHAHPDPDGGPTDTQLTALEGFFDRYAELYCDGLFACESGYAALSDAGCRDVIRSFYGVEQYRALLESGAMRFDADRATACLALLEDAPGCAFDWSEEYCFEDAGVFVGATPEGGACDSDAYWLCAPGTRCSADRFGSACGVCEALTPVALGGACAYTADCAQSASALAYCGFVDEDAEVTTCVRWENPTLVGVGNDCAVGNVLCAVGAQCDWDDTGRCVAQPVAGDECDPGSSIDCADGGECVEDAGSALGGTCYALALGREAGDACGVVGASWVWCVESDGLVCDESLGECVALDPGVDGDACDDADCAAGFYCDRSASADVCRPKKADGSPCVSRSECSSGWCFGDDEAVCGALGSLAAACAP